jgi:hypothetical protein
MEEGVTKCVQCGCEAETQGANNGITVTLPPVKLPDKGQFTRFLGFDIMITPMIMKVLYVIGSIGIVLFMLFIMFSGFAVSFGAGVLGFFGGLLGGILGLVFYRIFCEQILLFFTMNDKLKEIRDNTR